MKTNRRPACEFDLDDEEAVWLALRECDVEDGGNSVILARDKADYRPIDIVVRAAVAHGCMDGYKLNRRKRTRFFRFELSGASEDSWGPEAQEFYEDYYQHRENGDMEVRAIFGCWPSPVYEKVEDYPSLAAIKKAARNKAKKKKRE